MAFNYLEAKKAGANDEQILDYLNKTRGYDVQGAIKAGAKKEQVIDYLATTSYGESEAPIPDKKEEGEKGIVGASVGFVKGRLNTLQNVGNLLVKPFYKAVGMGDVKTGIDPEILKTKGTAEKVGDFIGQTAEFVIPSSKIAKGLSGSSRLIKTAGQVASDVAVNTAQQGNIDGALGTGITTAVLSNIPLVGKLLSEKGSIIVENRAKNLEQINLRLTPPQKLALKKSTNDVIGFLSKQKVTGTPEVRYEKISSIVDGFEDKVQKTIVASGKKYSKEEIINAVKDIPSSSIDQINNPEVLNQMARNVDGFIKFVEKQTGDFIDAARVNAFKRNYAKNARNKAGDTVINEAREAISDGLYAILQKDVPTLKEINKPYSQALLSQKLLGKAIGRNELGLIGNLIAIATGATVGAGTGPIGGAIGGIVGPQVAKQLIGTNTRSRVGAGLQTLSEYLAKAKTTPEGNFVIPKSIINSLFNN